MSERSNSSSRAFVEWFRSSAPYIHAHRGSTFVVYFGGECVAHPSFGHLVQDIALLHSLGVRLVLVFGARPQIEERLREANVGSEYADGLRITDERTLRCVKEAVGKTRVEIEAQLSMGIATSPMAGARIRVASGNFVIAQPVGVRRGLDYGHTGIVRRVDREGIEARLDKGAVVLLSPLGYSLTGEIFNVSAHEVASAVAIALSADKLLMMTDGPGILDTRRKLIPQLTLSEARQLLQSRRRRLHDETRRPLEAAVRACDKGVRRAHLVGRHIDGVLLLELFTRDGTGTLIASDTYETVRQATIEDVGGILELLSPLEAQGVLVRRPRERLETEIPSFTVVVRDGLILGCAALFSWQSRAAGELACLVVHPAYRGTGWGDRLLETIESKARDQGLRELFVLTTHTSHWFLERGFAGASVEDLPDERQQLYNFSRNSKVLRKKLEPKRRRRHL